MKNSKYFPFERNKYFYGKLLSVDDFELEQRYINNKRRMTNRFLYGAGIVAGLYIVRLDEKTISVEPGFALDPLGREIVVDAPAIRKLSLIDGYKSCVEESEGDYVYLCLDYQEEETGAIHNIAGNYTLQGEETFNKIKETYRLYLTDSEPGRTILDQSGLYETCQIVYARNGIAIRQFVSKYALAGGTAELRIEIENLTKKYLAFSYELTLEYLTHDGQSILNINFNEMQHEKTGQYTLRYTLEAASAPGLQGSLLYGVGSGRMFLDKEECAAELQQEPAAVQITDKDIRQQIAEDCHRMGMDQMVREDQQTELYLAKLYLLHVGDSYVIDRVENAPFRQYVLNQNLSMAIHQLTMEGDGAGKDLTQKEKGLHRGGRRKERENSVSIAQGTYWLDMDGGGEKGDRYISEEIAHGLGLGPAIVQVGLEDEDGAIVCGSGEIFEDRAPALELAVKVFPEKGTFQIGIRLLEQVIQSGINIHWSALLNEEEKIVEKITRKIFIKPSVLELSTRESHYLEAVCSNMADQTIEWNVKEHGGTISENGMYTAPNTPGVYEVVAQSAAFPEVKASVFVIVRDA